MLSLGKSAPKRPIKSLGKMAVLRYSLEMQISKTRFPSDSGLTGFATAERVIPVIAAQGQERPGKIEVWIPKTKAGNVSSLFFQRLTGRSKSETRAETKKKQLGGNSGNLERQGGWSMVGLDSKGTQMGNRLRFIFKASMCK